MRLILFLCSILLSFCAVADDVICELESNYDEFIEMPEKISHSIDGEDFQLKMVANGPVADCKFVSTSEMLSVVLCGSEDAGLYLLLDKNSQMTLLDSQYLTPLAKYNCQENAGDDS